jgi:hypothetical protein
MKQNNIAYLINSTPKYYYILELHLVLLRRYAPNLKWQVYLATEEPEHPVCRLLVEKYDVKLLVLEKENSSFLTSRKRALELLPEDIDLVLPMQEDFLLERFIDEEAIENSIRYLNGYPRLISVRYMPCPGPQGSKKYTKWLGISQEYDIYGFTFQATLWKRWACQQWYNAITNRLKTYRDIDSKVLEVDMNIAESADGQQLYYLLFNDNIIIGWPRAYKESNAVYHCPWPYRPTAIIKGVLQPFAKELAVREGVNIGFQN